MPLHATSNGISSSAYACLQNPILQPIFQSLFAFLHTISFVLHQWKRVPQWKYAPMSGGFKNDVIINFRCYQVVLCFRPLVLSSPRRSNTGVNKHAKFGHPCRKVWASLSKNQADRKSRRATPKQPYLSPVVCRPVIACHLVIILHNPDKCSSVCVKNST